MLLLHERVNEEMITEALNAFPDECCGFFFGEEEDDERIVTAIQPVINSKEGDKRRRFEISAGDYMKAERFAAENGLQLLGVYHSHPGHPAVPSEHDRAAAQPYFSYIIISVINSEWDHTRSWRLNTEQQFEEENVTDLKLINN